MDVLSSLDKHVDGRRTHSTMWVFFFYNFTSEEIRNLNPSSKVSLVWKSRTIHMLNKCSVPEEKHGEKS